MSRGFKIVIELFIKDVVKSSSERKNFFVLYLSLTSLNTLLSVFFRISEVGMICSMFAREVFLARSSVG